MEDNQDKLQARAFAEEGEDIEGRGRKRRRSDDDSDMEDLEESKKTPSKKTANSKKMFRSMTPAQLKIHSQSKLRSMSKGRREGSVPQPHPTRVVPEEHIRLAKKINKRFKHSINVNEADRVISVKKPKHLYSGKRGIGKNDRR